MWKTRLIVQTIVCIMIAGGYSVIQQMDAPGIQEKTDAAVAAMSRHYTAADIADKGRTAVMSIIKAPVTVTSHIIESQETRKYGLPVDDIPSGETGPVYAAAGGRVEETGENEELGLYIKVSHGDSVTTYGNCDRLYASESEHVRKGQIIASFTNDGSKEFYYRLEE